ncbi:hypothetical protein OHB24_20805 [Kribbella sp. NBC_00482]|uniref:hypothetical protein n=1 Tax=Kribbella sp. NBC_00482 TaxID=2975968 RepID=UPI002E196AC5
MGDAFEFGVHLGDHEFSAAGVVVEQFAVAAQSMAMSSCCSALSAEKPRRRRSRKKSSRRDPSSLFYSARQMVRTSGACSTASFANNSLLPRMYRSQVRQVGRRRLDRRRLPRPLRSAAVSALAPPLGPAAG